MRLCITYFNADGSVNSAAIATAVPTGDGNVFEQADFDLCVKNCWPEDPMSGASLASTAVCYQNSTTAQSYANKPA